MDIGSKAESSELNEEHTDKPTLLISIDQIRVGDVLLCYKRANGNPISKKITSVTNSDYTHAAICVASGTAAESTTRNGVSKVKISDLVKRYDHLAVFRSPDAWTNLEPVEAMSLFIDTLINNGAKYNFKDVLTFKKRSDIHQLSLIDQVKAYFDEDHNSDPDSQCNYFCSELVATCFVVSGFVGPSAEIIFKPNVTSPGALGRDVVYGTFYGYASEKPNYQVPSTDEFRNFQTFTQIFGNDA